MRSSDSGKPPAILLDASGTVLNDLKITHKIVNQILDHYDKPQMTISEFKGIFSLPYWKLFEGFGLSKHTAKEECLQLYKRLVLENLQKITIFADVEPTLRLLCRTKRIGLVSQMPKSVLEELLAKSGIEHYFSKIISLEDSAEQKPSPLPLLLACESMDCKPCEAIFAGDQYEDIMAAKNARMFSIGVSRRHSYHTYPKLVSAQPDLIISSLSELINLEVITC